MLRANSPPETLEPALRLESRSHISRALPPLALVAVLYFVIGPGDPLAQGDVLGASDAVPRPAASLDPADTAAARSLAEVKAALDRGDLSVAELNLAPARGAAALAPYVDLFAARLELAKGNAGLAAAAARLGGDAHSASPVSSAFSQLLGDALLAAADETGARAAWRVALQQAGGRERKQTLRVAIRASHERTGTLHAALEEGDDTETLVRTETTLPPSLAKALATADARVGYADQLLNRGRTADAITEYGAALAGDLSEERRRHAVLQRGHALFRVRRYEEATRAFASLVDEPEARFWRARARVRGGDPDGAISDFEAIAAAGDEQYGSWALYLAGTLLEDRGDTARALAHYETVAQQTLLEESA